MVNGDLTEWFLEVAMVRSRMRRCGRTYPFGGRAVGEAPFLA